MALTFRPLVAGDLATLHRWLNEPGVVRWWEGDEVSWPAVLRDYGDTRADAEEHFIAVLDGRPVGWIQCAALADIPEDAELMAPLGLHPTAATIDYLLGSPRDRGRGLGGAMIRGFVALCWQLHPEWTQICVAPQAANFASWRALEAAGFRQIAILPDRLGPCRAMLLDRPL